MDSTPVVTSIETQSSANTNSTSTTTMTVNANQVNLSIQPAVNNEHALTPEQEEEIKLRAKYPNPSKPGGSAFIQKILNKGHKKYFDSGDYNMAKSKNKALNKNIIPQVTAAVNTTATATVVVQPQPNEPLSVAPNISINECQQSPPVTTTTTAITVTTATRLDSTNPTSPHITSTGSLTNTASNSITLTPSITTNSLHQHQHQQHHMHQTSPLSSNINIVNNNHTTNSAVSPMLSNSLSSSSAAALVSTLASYQQQQQQTAPHPQMSTSVSTQSIHMLSASLSTEKLAQIQLNAANNSANTLLLDSEEIGHGIPTPECLPQSRKHSIVQSKLATPRLSSS
jgi:hypothetical protein